jgi:hypothetical protein
VPVEGGDETEVVPGPLPDGQDWALSASGIDYATMAVQTIYRSHEYTIQFLDFESGQVVELFRREGLFLQSRLAVSPDEEWVLFGGTPARESELMLVENFR